MARRVDDAPVCRAQDDVGVTPHDFDNQRAGHGIAQLAEIADVYFENTVACDALHGKHAPAAEILAQKHAQHGRLHRTRLGVAAQMGAGGTRRRAEYKAMVCTACAYEQVNFVFFGLNHAVHAPIAQNAVQFAGDKAEHNAVHRHGEFLLCV